MSLIDESRRGDLAAEVLQNDVYTDAYAKVEAAIYAGWRDAENATDAEHLRQMGKLLRKVQTLMEGVLKSGKIADKALEQERSRIERLGQALRRVA